LANQKRPPGLGEFLGSLSVKRVPNSRLMEVSFESTDPQLAARVVNAHIASYIEQNFSSKYEATTRASAWLADQLTELKIKVQRAEDARIAYERQNQIWTLDDKQNITSQRLGDINRQLTEAQSERMKKESLYQFAKSGNLDAVPQIQSNLALAELFKKRSERTMTKASKKGKRTYWVFWRAIIAKRSSANLSSCRRSINRRPKLTRWPKSLWSTTFSSARRKRTRPSTKA